MEMRVGSVLSRVGEIYRDNFGVLIGTAVVLYAIEFVVTLFIGILAGLILLVLGVLYQGMVVELVRDVQDGRRDHSVGQLLRAVEPVLLPLIGVSILFAIGVAIGLILIIIPGLYLLTIWAVVAPVMVLEHPGVFTTFDRSHQLVRGHGWTVFGVIASIFFAVFVVDVIVGAIASGLGSVGQALVQYAISAVLAPLPALAASVLYFGLKAAHGEGTAAGAPAVSPAAPAAPATSGAPTTPSTPATTDAPTTPSTPPPSSPPPA